MPHHVFFIQVFRPHFSTRLEDYCDGTLFSEHPLFSVNECGLQVMLYYDDVEVCNPLGSAATVHKLGECINTDTVNFRSLHL